MFSCEFCEIFRNNICFTEHLQATCSMLNYWKISKVLPGSLVLYLHGFTKYQEPWFFRSSRREVFCKKYVLKNLEKFKVKHRPATLLNKRLWQRLFPVNFVKFLRTPFFYRKPPVPASVCCFGCNWWIKNLWKIANVEWHYFSQIRIKWECSDYILPKKKCTKYCKLTRDCRDLSYFIFVCLYCFLQ